MNGNYNGFWIALWILFGRLDSLSMPNGYVYICYRTKDDGEGGIPTS